MSPGTRTSAVRGVREDDAVTTQETSTPPAVFDVSGLDPAALARVAIVDDLEWRGLVADSTSLDALRAAAADGPVTLYCGFDPTAPSLHMGNLLQILTVRRFQLAGHRPLALVGGATGMIGDPKESGERTLNPTDVVEAWVARIRAQLERFFDFDAPDNPARMVNNYDWTAGLSTLEFLRDVGKHFSVNRMLDREAVAARLAGNGISYTEFSYQLLQSYDYLQLHQRARLHAADRRLRPVGQHRRGRRPDPPRHRGARARAHDAAGHQGRRDQVRQDRVGHRLARPGADLAVRLLPVLAQHRGRDHGHAPADVLVPVARRDRGARGVAA